MLGIRLEGQPEEYRAMVEKMRSAGIEIQVQREISRGQTWQAYAIARLADTPDAPAGPVRVNATLGTAAPELPAAPTRGRRRR